MLDHRRWEASQFATGYGAAVSRAPNREEQAMRLTSAQVERALNQFDAQAIPEYQKALEMKPGLYQAELNLGFTKIASPIDGLAGIALAQIGDLVGPNGPVLTTVSSRIAPASNSDGEEISTA